MRIRVVLAEDNALLRDGLVRLFERIDDIDVVGSCSSLPELLAMVDVEHPDVVVTDIRMPPTGTDEGIQAARMIRINHPSIGVVVLSQYASPSYALALLESGSERRGYLLKDRVADVDDLADAIRTVAKGGSRIDSRVVDELVVARSQTASSPLELLTPARSRSSERLPRVNPTQRLRARCICQNAPWRSIQDSIFSKLGIANEPDVNRRVRAVVVYLSATTEGLRHPK